MDNLPLNRLLELLEVLGKIRQEEAKEKLVNGAWIGFQMGAGGEKNFGQYLESIGLIESKEEPMPQITIEEAMAKGQRIREKAKKLKEQRKK
uniref:Uncharacterized protein n=1 Tax=viral metagenome TaxID=1070528 RepID=A0A6M3IP57_9ZZZZ